jgi:hypothetical protein
MFGSIVSVIIAGVLNVGSITDAFAIASDGGRLQLFEMSPGIVLLSSVLFCFVYVV